MQQLIRFHPRRALAVLASTAVLAACDAPSASPTAPTATRPAAAAVAYTEVAQDVPVHNPIVMPCAVGGPQIVIFDGTEHTLFQTTANAAGGGHVRMHVNANDVTGYAVITGEEYRASGTTQDAIDWDAAQFPTTSMVTYSFNVTSPGRTGNIVAHETLQVDYDADGRPTVREVNFSAECR